FLYREYLKVLSEIRPEAFVMENVKGILSSNVAGSPIFPKLLDDLRSPDRALRKRSNASSTYKIYSLVSGVPVGDLTGSPKDCVIRAEDFGVPQVRHRVILLGVREDIQRQPNALIRAETRTTVWEMLSGLPPLRSGLSRTGDSHRSCQYALLGQGTLVAREHASRM